MPRSVLCISRCELSNEYFLAKIGFDAAENATCKICPFSVYSPDDGDYYFCYRSPRCVFLEHSFQKSEAFLISGALEAKRCIRRRVCLN